MVFISEKKSLVPLNSYFYFGEWMSKNVNVIQYGHDLNLRLLFFRDLALSSPPNYASIHSHAL